METRTIKTTAKNLIKGLAEDKAQTLRVAQFEVKRMQNEEEAKATIKRHNERCDEMIHMMCMLYITCYEGSSVGRMSDECDKMMDEVYKLRVDFWDDVLYAE